MDRDDAPPTSPQQEGTPDLTRRRLTGAGIAAAPVLLSLSARPAWGNQCTISAMMSGNASVPQVTCEGCTPGYWGQHPFNWPAPYDPGGCVQGVVGNHCKGNEYDDTGTQYHSVFIVTATHDFGTETMMQVIQKMGTEDKYQLGAHAVASLLNATVLTNFGYEPADIIQLYTDNAATDPEGLKILFQTLNERVCPL